MWDDKFWSYLSDRLIGTNFTLMYEKIKISVKYEIDLVKYEIDLLKYEIDLVKYEIDWVKYEIDLVKYEIDLVKYEIDSVKYEIDSVKYEIDSVNYHWLVFLFKLQNRKLFSMTVMFLNRKESDRSLIHCDNMWKVDRRSANKWRKGWFMIHLYHYNYS